MKTLNSFKKVRSAGFTLTEMLVTVAIIGVLAAVTIQVYGHITSTSQSEVAESNISQLNRSVSTYAQAVQELNIAANSGAVDDELLVLSKLGTKLYDVPGTPYIDVTKWPKVSSNDSTSNRLIWNGYAFELLPVGTSGVGLYMNSGR